MTLTYNGSSFKPKKKMRMTCMQKKTTYIAFYRKTLFVYSLLDTINQAVYGMLVYSHLFWCIGLIQLSSLVDQAQEQKFSESVMGSHHNID